MKLSRGALLACLVAIWFRPGPALLLGTDSGCYARVAKEWAARPLGAALTLGGERFIEHPPLALWLEGLAFRLFGASVHVAEFVAHAWAALLVLLIGALAGRLARPHDAERVAAFSMLSVLTIPAFLQTSQVAMLEAPLAVMIAFAMLGLVRERRWQVVAGFVGAAWVKGPPALIIIGLIGVLAMWRWLSVRWALSTAVLALGSLAVTVGVNEAVAPFWSDYWHHQVMASVVEGRHHPDANPLYFAKPLLNWYAPGLIAVVLAALLRRHERFEPKLAMLGGVTWLGVVVGFSLPMQKYDWYIYPGVIGAALVLGSAVSVMPSRFDRRITSVLMVSSIVWIVCSLSIGDRFLTAQQRQIFAIQRQALPVEPIVVADCSTLGPWLSEHLMAFAWSAKRVSCSEPATWRFDGSTLTPQP